MRPGLGVGGYCLLLELTQAALVILGINITHCQYHCSGYLANGDVVRGDASCRAPLSMRASNPGLSVPMVACSAQPPVCHAASPFMPGEFCFSESAVSFVLLLCSGSHFHLSLIVHPPGRRSTP